MFGKNIILKQERDLNGALDVHSIFHTIQGEGPLAGHSAVFVRLYGCSLACSWCDTEFESKQQRMLPARLLAAVTSAYPPGAKPPLVVITGGEPMRQYLTPAISALLAAQHEVQIETAGIHWEGQLESLRTPPHEFSAPLPIFLVCSPKLPGVHPKIVEYADAFKYIVDVRDEPDPEDGLPIHAVSQRGLPNPGRLFRPFWLFAYPEKIMVQPLDPSPETPDRDWLFDRNCNRCVELVKRYGYRLSLQQHKILGLE